MSSVLETAQAEIFYKVAGEDYLAAVTVLLARKERIASEIEQALNVMGGAVGKKPGACVIVMMPVIDVADPEVRGPQLEALFTLRTLENPSMNLHATGTGKTAEDLALFVLRALHLWQICERLGSLYAGRQAVVPAVVEGLIGYDVTLKARVGQDVEAQCVAPVMAVAGNEVVVSSETAGAEIWVTVDGSYPYRGTLNGRATTAIPMASGLAYAEGGQYRAVAYKTGYLGSDVAEMLT